MSRVWPFKILANATSHREIVRSAITSHRSKPAHTGCPRSGTYIFPSFLASNNVAVRAASGSDTITLQFYLWMMNTAYYSNDRHDDCKSIYRIHIIWHLFRVRHSFGHKSRTQSHVAQNDMSEDDTEFQIEIETANRIAWIIICATHTFFVHYAQDLADCSWRWPWPYNDLVHFPGLTESGPTVVNAHHRQRMDFTAQPLGKSDNERLMSGRFFSLGEQINVELNMLLPASLSSRTR